MLAATFHNDDVRSWALALLVALAALAALSLSWQGETSGPAYVDSVYLPDHPVVIASDKLVCSLASGQQQAAGIVGKDGSHSVEVDGVVYWNFGDTVLANGGLIPNSISWSADTNAEDCISLVPKSGAGRAVSLLPSNLAEITVWPSGMAATSDNTIHFFYASVVSGNDDNWRVAGVGLASFDTKTLTAKRAFDGALPWPAGFPQPMRTVVDGDYVYMLLGTALDEQWQTRTLLARVPIDSIEALEAYEYWQPRSGLLPGQWLSGLWDEEAGTWGPTVNEIRALWSQPGGHNGVDVAYNEYVGRWLAIYSSGFMTAISVRAADELTGPWDGPQVTLVDCPIFHPSPDNALICYSGTQQEVYTRDGGRTIYVSYSNSDDYEVYLHEVRLAARIDEWNDASGRSLYLAGDEDAPDAYVRKAPAFYAADIPVPGFVPIHRWVGPDRGEVRYGPIAPNATYADRGIDFYAPADQVAANATNALYDPVYRWVRGGKTRYSGLNLTQDGYVRMEEAFYAACPDSDTDGLTDCYESFLGTDPLLADTDGDGLLDGYEESTPGCSALVYNDDHDGTPTNEELVLGVNPCVWGTGVREVVAGQSSEAGTS